MSTDLLEHLDSLRPAPVLADAERDDMLALILGSDRSAARREPWSPRRRRMVVGGSLAALAAAAAIVVPAVAPSSTPVVGHASPAAAAELRRLAVVVEHGQSVTLGPHRYLYIAEGEVQKGMVGFAATGKTVHGVGTTHPVYGTASTHREGWTSRAGRLWRRDDSSSPVGGHRVDDYVIAPDDVDSPAHFASLPTDPAKLSTYLREDSGYGSDSDQDVFEQLEFILQTGIAPSALRSAALDVLADTDHVTVTKHVRDSMGRPAERFTLTYRSQRRTGTESVCLDPSNARVLETTMDGFGTTFVDTVRVERVVNSVPASVRRGAAHHK